MIKIYKYSLILISLFTIWGGLIYKSYSLNNWGIGVSIILSFLSFFIILFFEEKNKEKDWSKFKKPIFPTKITAAEIITLGSYLTFFAISLWLLREGRSPDNLISPWQSVPQRFFFTYTTASILLLISIIKNSRFSRLLINIHFFLSISICLIVYKFGFGFDPFIHEATLKFIKEHGTINPKPFYYLGYYGLTMIVHKISFIPLEIVNKGVLIILATLYIPEATRAASQKISPSPITNNITTLLLLTFLTSLFIVSTPQGLSYFFLLLTVLSLAEIKEKREFISPTLFSLAAFLTHPIAGIPALLTTALFYIFKIENQKLKKFSPPILLGLLALLLPLAFLWNEIKSNPEVLTKINLQNLQNIPLPILSAPKQESLILNFVEFCKKNTILAIFAILISGIFIANRNKERYQNILIQLDVLLALILSFFLTNLLPFEFLISYERSDYAERILVVIFISAIPFWLVTSNSLIEAVKKENNLVKIPIIIFTALLITSGLYNSYPRFDNYLNSKGYATGKNEIAAVKKIHEDAGGKNYVVMANQQVSAAALREFGFKKYYKENIFFYSIPTGGPLYQKYLDMVYKKPDQATAVAAMEMAGTDIAYLVVNKYWWAFPKIIEEAKLTAHQWEKIGQDDIYIFKYQK